MLVFAMSLGLAACGNTVSQNNASTDDGNNVPEPPATDNNGENALPDQDTNGNTDTVPGDSSVEDDVAKPTVLKFNDFVSTLSSSPYRDFITTNKSYGVTDATVIGVNKDRFENEILYAFPDDSEFAKIVDLSERNFGADKSDAENSSAIASALSELKTVDGNKKLIIPAGTFKISRAITVDAFEDLYIEGNGTTFVSTAWTHGIYINNSENIHLSGVEFTSENTPLLTGKVTAYDPSTRTVTLKIEDEHNLAYSGFGSTITGYYDLKWSEEDGRYYLNTSANLRYALNDTLERDLSSHSVKIKFSSNPDVPPEADDMVSIAVVSGTGATCTVYTTLSKNVYFENIGINSNSGMGFVSINSENLYVNKLTIAPNFERKLYMSTSWDGLHTVGLRGDLVITNSIIEGTQDDCLNVCGSYDIVKTAAAKKLLLENNNSFILAGDTIEIYDPATMKFCGSYVVTAIDGTILSLDSRLDDSITEGFLVGNVSGATHLTIDNCIFGNGYSRGGLIQTRDTKIINTTYFNLTLQALNIHSSYDQYAEAIMPRNVLVENCKFITTNVKQYIYSSVQVITHNGKGGSTPGTLTDVHINNNFFSDAGGGAVTFYGAGNSSFTNNLVHNIDRIQNNALGILDDCAIGLVSSSDITLKNNYIYIEQANPMYDLIHQQEVTGLTNEDNTLKLVK